MSHNHTHSHHTFGRDTLAIEFQHSAHINHMVWENGTPLGINYYLGIYPPVEGTNMNVNVAEVVQVRKWFAESQPCQAGLAHRVRTASTHAHMWSVPVAMPPALPTPETPRAAPQMQMQVLSRELGKEYPPDRFVDLSYHWRKATVEGMPRRSSNHSTRVASVAHSSYRRRGTAEA